MAMSKSYAKYGSWAFIIGLIITIVAGFISTTLDPQYALVLGILGLIVGLINVTDRETQLFLVATVALMLSASSLASVVSFSPQAAQILQTILNYIVAFVSPAAAIVALKAVYDISKEQ